MKTHNTEALENVNTTVACLKNTFVLDFGNMRMTYGERLRAARKNKNLTQPRLSSISGVGQGSISKIERGDQDSSAYDIELSYALDVHPLWLKNGDERFIPEWMGGKALPENHFTDGPTLGNFSAIPVVGSAQLGDNGHWSALDYPVGFGDGLITYPSRDKNAYALRCVGDSMKPRIRDGEFVIVEPNSEPIPGDEILLKTQDGRVMVKTLLYQRDDKIHVMSVNEAHPPQAFALADIDKIHLVAAIAKKALWRKE